MFFYPLTLRAGSAVWTDNVIDAADASLVGAFYGRTVDDLEPGETLDADVNFDGVVNLRDLALVAGSYGLTSETAYADWQP
ncbi:MAG: dockerin type I domain-containing protein [Chloroflexota bacterium]|nr:dockerin type I domain-containing protein [Chloroflexota bacterium]